MRTKKGTVTSAKMKNTVSVTVSRLVMHSKYRKRYPLSKKFLADTAGIDVKEGDVVTIGETRPTSKRKRFKVLEVVAHGEAGGMSLEQELAEASGKQSEESDSEPQDAS